MTFEGFTPPVDDYFRMPNEWINICAKMDSLSELKIIQYVLRHTWGYQGFSGARKITIDEFMYGRKRKDGSRIDDGTGLSKQSVITAVGLAIQHGYLTCDTDKKDLARQKKYYQLAMKSDVKMLDSNSDVKDLDIKTDVKNLDIPGVKDLDPDVKDLDSGGQEFRQRSEKDTIERHYRKTEERYSCDVANANITEGIQSSQSDVSQDDEEEIKKRDIFMEMVYEAVEQANNGTRTRTHTKTVKVTVPKQKTAKKEPTPEEQAFQARCSALQAQINEWRGWTLTHKGQIINERKAIRTLAETYTDEQIAKIREYLFNKHWRYSKPDNRYTIGGQIILDEAGNVQQILKNASNGHSPPGSNGAKPRPSALVSEEQAAKNKARLYAAAAAKQAEKAGGQ